MAVRRRAITTREDFIVEQFPFMKKLNGICAKYFEAYYIDVDPNAELSAMMRQVMPDFYVDPFNPEYPGRYIIAGKALESYFERILFMTPYVDEKGKITGDVSAYKGMLFNPEEFKEKTKPFRKSKLAPVVLLGETQFHERTPQNLVLGEETSKEKDRITIPFLQLPSRGREGEEIYRAALQQLIYQRFYAHMMNYVGQDLCFEHIDAQVIEDLVDFFSVDIQTPQGDIVTLTKELIPNLNRENAYSLAFVPKELMNDPESIKHHYILREQTLTPDGIPFIEVYTLMSVLPLE